MADQIQIDRGDFLPDDIPKTESAPAPDTALEDELLKKDDPAPAEEPAADTAPKDPDEPELDDPAPQPRDDKGRFDTKEPKIPKARFDEAVGKEREAREAAEKRAADLERQLAERAKSEEKGAEIEKIEASIAALEKSHAQYLLDGEADKAAEAMRQIRHAERQIARAEAQADAKATTGQILEAERFELAVAKLEADHPALNPQSETYDPDLIEFVLARQSRLVAGGMAPSKAIAEAAEAVMKRFATEPAQKDEPEGLAKASTTAADRKAAQVAKNLETAKAQPASTKEVGLDSDKLGEKAAGLPNIGQMTPEEYAALPAATRAKLRGDLG